MLYVLNVHLFAVYIEIAKIPQICYTQSSSAHWGELFSKEVLLSLLYESSNSYWEFKPANLRII